MLNDRFSLISLCSILLAEITLKQTYAAILLEYFPHENYKWTCNPRALPKSTSWIYLKCSVLYFMFIFVFMILCLEL